MFLTKYLGRAVRKGLKVASRPTAVVVIVINFVGVVPIHLFAALLAVDLIFRRLKDTLVDHHLGG